VKFPASFDPVSTGIEGLDPFALRLSSQLSTTSLMVTYFCVVILWFDAISRKSLIQKFPSRVIKIVLLYSGLNYMTTVALIVSAFILDNSNIVSISSFVLAGQGSVIQLLYLVKKNINFFWNYFFVQIFMAKFLYQICLSKSSNFRSSAIVKRITIFTGVTFLAGTFATILFYLEDALQTVGFTYI
jgi:hypothetical protein